MSVSGDLSCVVIYKFSFSVNSYLANFLPVDFLQKSLFCVLGTAVAAAANAAAAGTVLVCSRAAALWLPLFSAPASAAQSQRAQSAL